MSVADERCKLDDLMSLGIHKYGEDVVAIVEKANKELQIDASLTKVPLRFYHPIRSTYLFHRSIKRGHLCAWNLHYTANLMYIC